MTLPVNSGKKIMDTVTLPDKYREGSGYKAGWMEERRQERVGKRK